MIKWKIKLQATFIFILFTTSLFTAFYMYSAKYEENDIYNDLSISATYNDIIIDDLPGSTRDWEWAENQPWLTYGSGKKNDPYFIENHIFEYSTGAGYCLTISNSRKYFIIRKCIFRNSDTLDVGLYLMDTTNGQILNCEIYNNNIGLLLETCQNILIQNSSITNNNYYGINLDDSTLNLITENNISQNTLRGISMVQSNDNNISKNLIKENDWDTGISFIDCSNIRISENQIISNGRLTYPGGWGIRVSINNDNAIIKRNEIRDNGGSGGIFVDGDNIQTFSEQIQISRCSELSEV